MKNIYNPCRFCHLYPRVCLKMCDSKKEYVNEVDEDVPVIKKQKKKRVFDNTYNKNGIRRS